MKKFKFSLIAILLAILIIPSITNAAWWNPFSWNWNFSNYSSRNKANVEVKTPSVSKSQPASVKSKPKTKINLNPAISTGSNYSIQDCYNACEGYATVQQRNLCKHSSSVRSCDVYGKPGPVLDNFVNGTKWAVERQNLEAIQTQQNLLDAQNYKPVCPTTTPTVDGPAPKGCY